LVAASNGGRSSGSGLTSSQGGDHLTPISYSGGWLQLLAPGLDWFQTAHLQLSILDRLPSRTNWFPSQSQSYVTTDGQSASLFWCQASIWAQDQTFISQLRVCWSGAPSLARGRVCRLQLLPVLASAVILGSKSHRTRGHILMSQIRDSPNLKGQGPVFISSRNRMTQLYPQVLGSSESQSYFTTGGLPPISLSWRQAPWGSRQRFFPTSRLTSYVASARIAYKTPLPALLLLYDVTIGAGRIGNTASNSYSIVACVRCLAMDLVLLRVTHPLPSIGCFSGSTIFAVS
jgi:hypothetical protein